MGDWVTALNAASAGDHRLSKQIECLMYIWWYEDRQKNGWRFNDRQEELYREFCQQVKDRIATWGLE